MIKRGDMTTNQNKENKCTINSKSSKDCMLKMVKSPSNWVI
jgi:hypothetical protein